MTVSSGGMVSVSREDLAEAIDHLDGVWDDGPPGAGWASTELIALRQRLRAVLDAPVVPEGPPTIGTCGGERQLHRHCGRADWRRVAPEGPPSPTPSLPDPEGQIHA
jgi:hypothetical protein